MYDAIVVGGGIAGLTAAYRLIQSGRSVLVLEAESYPGGRIKTISYESSYAEAGASVVTADEECALELMNELGITDKIELGNHGVELFLNGHYLRMSRIDGRATSIKDALSLFRVAAATVPRRADIFSLKNLRLLRAYRRALAQIAYEAKRITFPYDPQVDSRWDSETFAQFLDRFHPRLRHYIDLQLKVTAGELSEHISLFWGLVAFHWNVSSKFYWLAGGTSKLPHAVAERLGPRLRLGASVQRIIRSASYSSSSVHFYSGGSTFTEHSKAVIVATPPHIVLKIVDRLTTRKRYALESVKFGSYVVVHLVCRSRFWENKIRTGYLNCSGVVFADLLDATKGQSSGSGILACFIAGPEARTYLAAPDDVIMNVLLPDLDKLFPIWRKELVLWRVFRWQYAIPYFPPNFGHHLSELRRPDDNLFFCGDYTQGAGINDAVISGQMAAQAVIAYLSCSDAPRS